MASTPSVTLSNFTGLDFNQILQADAAAAQVPITALDNQLTAVNTSISTLGTIQGDFTSLQSALNALNTSLTIPPSGVSVSHNAPFSAASTGGAVNGTIMSPSRNSRRRRVWPHKDMPATTLV